MTTKTAKKAPGLEDVLPASKVVRGITVTGIPLEDLFSIVTRYADLAVLWREGKLDPALLITAVPEAVGAIIAAATGHLNDAAQEGIARRLPPVAMLDFVEAVIETTFEGDPTPFVKRLREKFGAFLPTTTDATVPASAASPKSTPLRSASAFKRGATRPLMPEPSPRAN